MYVRIHLIYENKIHKKSHNNSFFMQINIIENNRNYLICSFMKLLYQEIKYEIILK